MDSSGILFFEAITAYFQFFFSNILSWITLLGLILWLLAAFTLGLYLWIKRSGYITPGKVLGYVIKRRLKTKTDGSTEEKTSTFLALEYQDQSGLSKRGLSSEWQPKYARYTDQQPVTVRVVSSPAYDDLYIANEHGALNLGLGFFVAGYLCFFRFWQLPALWVSGLVILILGILLTICFMSRVAPPTVVPPEKQFDNNEIQPM